MISVANMFPPTCKVPETGSRVLIPTFPVEPVTNSLILPAPSDRMMLQLDAEINEPELDPITTLQPPVVIEQPAILPKVILLQPVVLQRKADVPIAVLELP